LSVVKAITNLTKIMGQTFVINNNPRSPISLIQGLLDIKTSFDNKDPLNPNFVLLKACVLVNVFYV